MAMSRRRLSFQGVTENTETDRGKTCSLCQTAHAQFSVPSAWKNDRAREMALTHLQLTHQSPVCRLCDDIGRTIRNPQIRPRWKRAEKVEKKCCIPTCTDICYSMLRVGTEEQVAKILECESLPHPTPLCQHHYHFVYDMLQPNYTHCCTCNSTLRNVRKRVCPNPEIIQQHLFTTTGFEGSIPQDGRVCPACEGASGRLTERMWL